MNTTGLTNNGVIALVDCNNFYVSCERVFNPALVGKPVAILSNNDGCIVSRSNELKDLKVPMGAPGFKHEPLILKHGGTILSSNYALYGDMSGRVMRSLEKFCPDIEIYSIDEAFLDLSGFVNRDMGEYCTLIKRKIWQWTGIPVSIGIGRTKTLAKIANRIAKKYPAYHGVFCMLDETREDKVLASIPVGDVWGIGRQYDKFLRQNKIETALELRDAEEKFINHYMTKVGHKTVLELRGYACIEMDESPAPKKTIVSSRSFSKQVTEFAELEEAVSTYITRAGEKLRLQKCVAGHLMVFLNTNRFKEGPQHNSSQSTTLFPPTAYTPELIRTAISLLKKTFLKGFEYKKAGVMLADIIPEGDVPLSIAETNYLDDRRKDVMQIIDHVNKRSGRDTLYYASSGIKKDWEMRRAKLSPSYTTSWKDIPKVK